jgi:microcystin-dependent protein
LPELDLIPAPVGGSGILSWADKNFQRIREAFLRLSSRLDSGKTGVIRTFAGTSVPEGWLLADGQAVSRDEYSALFNVIGTLYGNGDGSSTFNVPDLHSTVLRGTTNSNWVSDTAGTDDQTLSRSEMPAHDHGNTDSGGGHQHGTDSVGDHDHGANIGSDNHNHRLNPGSTKDVVIADGFGPVQYDSGGSYDGVYQPDSDYYTDDVSHDHSINVYTGGGHSHGYTDGGGSHNHDIDNEGGGSSFENRPFFMNLLVIIGT